MVALALLLEKFDRYVPWAPWVMGTHRIRRNGGGR